MTDFAKLDVRAIAEKGVKLRLLHPETRKPLGSEAKPAVVFLEGGASRNVQAKFRQMARDKIAAPEGQDGAKFEVVEDIHNSMVRAALPHISGFENVSYKGVDAKDVQALAEAVLNSSFPILKTNKAAEDDEDLENLPFAKQIIDRVAEMRRPAGNA